jgi:hypothetical protein
MKPHNCNLDAKAGLAAATLLERPASGSQTPLDVRARRDNVGDMKTPSQIYLAAWIAAEDALPPESLKLITDYNAQHAKWREAGWPTPIPEPVVTANKAVEADPLASIAFEMRRKCNEAKHAEWQLEEESK